MVLQSNMILICFICFICLLKVSSCLPASKVAGALQDLDWGTSVNNLELSIAWNLTHTSQNGIPDFLNGTLYRNLPAIWRYGSNTSEQYTNPHWFSGLAMIHSFRFIHTSNHNPHSHQHSNINNINNINITIKYNARFLNSTTYKQARSSTQLHPDTTNNTKPTSSTYKSYNTDVTIRRVNGNTLLANTGELISNSFSYKNVSTIDAPYFFNDTIWQSYNATTNAPSHSQYDPDTNELFHFFYNLDNINSTSSSSLMNVNWNSKRDSSSSRFSYVFYSVKPDTNKRILSTNQLVPQNRLKIPTFQHSFGLTKHYRILCEQPQMLSRTGPGRWIPDMDTTIYVLDRYHGNLIKTFKTEAFAFYHWINSYEINDTSIVIDLIFDDTNSNDVYDALYLNQMIYNWKKVVNVSCRAKAIRFVLNIGENVKNDTFVQYQSLLTQRSGYELPIINPNYNGKYYNYMYGVNVLDCNDENKMTMHMLESVNQSQFQDSIIKVNVNNNDYLVWFDNYAQFPGEPIFVARGNVNDYQEDDGVLLSIVFDGNHNSSYLLILNATNLWEIGRAYIPKNYISHIPLGFHGRYYYDL